MPNYCDNFIKVYFNQDKPKEREYIEKLKKAVKENQLCNFLVPMPKHQPDLSKPNPFFREGSLGSEEMKIYGRNNWYDWSIDNWGTKWEIDSGDAEIIDDVLYINFVSAWSPPTRATDFIKLPFEHFYAETGVSFMGHSIKKNRKAKPIDTYTDIYFPDTINRKSEHEVAKALIDICLNKGLDTDLPEAMGLIMTFTDYDE